MKSSLFEEIRNIVGEEYIKLNEPMASHCTFRCGGNAEAYVMPGNIDELAAVVAACRKADYPFMVMGNGSNLLVRDEGYAGVIIEIGNRISNIIVKVEDIEVEAGAKLSAIAIIAM